MRDQLGSGMHDILLEVGAKVSKPMRANVLNTQYLKPRTKPVTGCRITVRDKVWIIDLINTHSCGTKLPDTQDQL